MKLTSLKAIFFVMLPDSRLLPVPPCPTAPVDEDRLPEPPDQLFQQQLISPVQKSRGGREHIEAAKNATRGTLDTNTSRTTTTIATTATTVTTTTLATDLSYSPPRHTYVTEQTRPYTFPGDHLPKHFRSTYTRSVTRLPSPCQTSCCTEDNLAFLRWAPTAPSANLPNTAGGLPG